MTHFGIMCPADTGHLNPMLTLGCELQRRGNTVTVFQVPDVEQKILSAGLKCRVIGKSEYPIGSMPKQYAEQGKLSGLIGVKFAIKTAGKLASMTFREAPDAISAEGIDLLIVDQVLLWGGTIAGFLDIPFISICCALLLNKETSIPPGFTNWNYNTSWWAHLRNQMGYSLVKPLAQPILDLVNEHRQKWKLSLLSNSNNSYSRLAQLSQQPPEFEFPRQHLPQCFHFTGPYTKEASREPVPFPFEKLTGKSLIYASMGTLQNRQQEIFQCIAEACAELDTQLVISLGGGSNPESLLKLPGSPLVVGYAPQLELLKKATLTITHAGLNTTLESLSNGVPMVAIPITNDQPGVAARIAWSGCGEAIPLKQLSIPKLRTAIKQVLTENSYKKNAIRLQEGIRQAGGVSRATDIVEQVVSTGKPVLSQANRSL